MKSLFTSGKIDWIGEPGTCDIHHVANKKKKSIFFPFIIYFNTSNALFSSSFIRRAFGYAVSRDEVMEKIFPTHLNFSTKIPLAPFSCNPIPQTGCLKKAKELFALGLHKLKANINGVAPIELYFCNIKSHVALARYLKTTWEATFGVKININILDWNFLYRDAEQKRFQVCGFFDYPPCGDFDLFLEQFCSRETNVSYWSDEEFVKCFHSLKQAKNPQEKKALFARLEDVLFAAMPFLPLVNLNYSYTHHPGFYNYWVDQDGSVDFCYAANQSTHV